MDAMQIQEILKKHELWLEGEDAGEKANLKGIDLRGADLRRVNLRSADLCLIDLSDADLSGANLRGANLGRANLSGANLRRAYLQSVVLCEARLNNADLSGADLTNANLHGADLSGANIDLAVWPTWWDSLGVKVDKRIIAQWADYFCSLDCVDGDDTVQEAFSQARTALLPLANQFHRTDDDVPRLE